MENDEFFGKIDEHVARKEPLVYSYRKDVMDVSELSCGLTVGMAAFHLPDLMVIDYLTAEDCGKILKEIASFWIAHPITQPVTIRKLRLPKHLETTVSINIVDDLDMYADLADVTLEYNQIKNLIARRPMRIFLLKNGETACPDCHGIRRSPKDTCHTKRQPKRAKRKKR